MNNYFGKRYVFFKELYNTNRTLYEDVKSHFSSTNSLFNKNNLKDKDENDTMNYINSYLIFIKELATTERNNEEAYLKKQIQLLMEDKDFINSDIGQKIKNISLDKHFNYLELIDLLNSLKENNEEYQKSIELVKKRFDTFKNYFNQDQWSSEVQEKIDKMYAEKYNSYINYMGDLLNLSWKNITENNNKTIAEKYNEEIQEIFKNCFKEDNLIKKLRSKITPSTDIVGLIQNLVVQYVTDNSKKDSNFEQWLDENIDEKIIEAMNSTENRVFFSETIKSFEDFALTNTQGLAEKLDEFGDQAEKVLDEYEPKDGPAHIAFGAFRKNTDSKSKKAKLTIELNKIFAKIRQEKIEKLNIQLEDNDIKKMTKEQKKQILATFEKLHTPSSIEKIISTTSSGPSSIAEILANPAVQSKLKKCFTTHTPGNKINLKDDVVFTCRFEPIEEKNFNKEEIDFKKSVDNFMKNFMRKYKEIGKGSTDVKSAQKAYEQQIEELKQEYDKIISSAENDCKEKEKLTKLLQETFFGGVSVKEYRYLNNNLGFHGGSLGEDGKIVPVITNILDMYEAGGLDTIDIEVIIEAILNYSDNMIGKEVIQIDNIKDYLLGGAAMLMFDDGFANTKPYLEMMKKNFDLAAPQTIHLYFLNGAYIPASYILQNIYENLKYIADDISQERLTNSKVKSSLYIKNDIKLGDLEYQKGDKSLMWGAYSWYAQENVKIKFLFMAGILDLFAELPNAFSDISI